MDDRLATTADGTASGAALGNDRDPDGDAVRVAAVGGGAPGRPVAGSNGGTFTVGDDGTVLFDPDGDFDALRGDDTAETRVAYTVTDDQGGESTATITVTVTAGNAPPELVAPAETQRGTDARPVAPLDMSALVRDPDGDALAYALAPGAPAWLSIDARTGVVTGTPPNDASAGGPEGDGRYPVTVRVSDGRHALDVPVTWTVRNPAPQAADDRGRTMANEPLAMAVLANDADPDGDDHWVSAVEGRPIAMGETVPLASGGAVTMVAPGQLRFDPTGTADDASAATFGYTIRDAQGAESTATVRVDIDRPPVDRPFDDDRPVPPPVDLVVPGGPTPLPPLLAGEPILTAALEVIDPLSPRVDIDVSSPEPILTQANEMARRLGGDVSLFGAPALTEALDRVADRDASDERWRALTGETSAGETSRGNEFCAHMGREPGSGHSALLRTHVRGDVVYLDLGTFGRERFAAWRVEGSGHARVAMLDRNIAQIERPADATHEHLDIRATARDGTRYHLPLRVDLLSGEITPDGPIREDLAAARPTLREQVAALDGPARQLDAIFGPPLKEGQRS